MRFLKNNATRQFNNLMQFISIIIEAVTPKPCTNINKLNCVPLASESIDLVIGGVGGSKITDPKLEEPKPTKPIASAQSLNDDVVRGIFGGSSGVKVPDPKLEEPDSGSSN